MNLEFCLDEIRMMPMRKYLVWNSYFWQDEVKFHPFLLKRVLVFWTFLIIEFQKKPEK